MTRAELEALVARVMMDPAGRLTHAQYYAEFPPAVIQTLIREIARLHLLLDRTRVELAYVETVERLRRDGDVLIEEIDAALGETP